MKDYIPILTGIATIIAAIIAAFVATQNTKNSKYSTPPELNRLDFWKKAYESIATLDNNADTSTGDSVDDQSDEQAKKISEDAIKGREEVKKSFNQTLMASFWEGYVEEIYTGPNRGRKLLLNLPKKYKTGSILEKPVFKNGISGGLLFLVILIIWGAYTVTLGRELWGKLSDEYKYFANLLSIIAIIPATFIGIILNPIIEKFSGKLEAYDSYSEIYKEKFNKEINFKNDRIYQYISHQSSIYSLNQTKLFPNLKRIILWTILSNALFFLVLWAAIMLISLPSLLDDLVNDPMLVLGLVTVQTFAIILFLYIFIPFSTIGDSVVGKWEYLKKYWKYLLKLPYSILADPSIIYTDFNNFIKFAKISVCVDGKNRGCKPIGTWLLYKNCVYLLTPSNCVKIDGNELAIITEISDIEEVNEFINVLKNGKIRNKYRIKLKVINNENLYYRKAQLKIDNNLFECKHVKNNLREVVDEILKK